jgi:hypothetical protein
MARRYLTIWFNTMGNRALVRPFLWNAIFGCA